VILYSAGGFSLYLSYNHDEAAGSTPFQRRFHDHISTQRKPMRKILFTLLITIILLPGAAMAFDHSYKLWNSDLKQFNEGGYIHYGAWQRNQARLTQFLGAIQAVTHREINGWTPAQKQAFWINVHNALVIIRVLEVYPATYRAHNREWMIAGQKMDVEDIRDKFLRGTESSVFILSAALGRDTSIGDGKNLRILFAICEGTKNSPPLSATAYTAKHLPEQLEQQVKRTLAMPSFLRVEPTFKLFHVGGFFRTYQRDFKKYQGDALLFDRTTASDRGVLRFIFPYLDQPTQDAILAKQQWPWRVDYHAARRSLNGGD